MKRRTVIRNAIVVQPGALLEGGCLLVEDGRIAAVRAGDAQRLGGESRSIDASGLYLLPGFVDLHNDNIEREVEPRPGILFPMDMAIREMERKLAAHGITTIFHSVSFANQELGVRSHHLAAQIVEMVKAQSESSLIRTKIHLRYEISDRSALPVIRRLIERECVQILSFMDHLPGQGQFRDKERYQEYLEKTYGTGATEFEELMARKTAARARVTAELAEMADFARANGVAALASHDDDTPEKIDQVSAWGVTISEFPVMMKAARHATDLGMSVCVGAPNVVRGGSQSKNLNALDAIQAGVAGILCSDYYPAALLHAVFRLAGGPLDLPNAVRMVTLNPARAVGLNDRIGSLEEGKLADLILVRIWQSLPVVVAVMVGGHWIYRVSYLDEGLDVEAGPVAIGGKC